MISDKFAIEINNLTKFYDKFKAVDNLSINVKKGEIFGFLGPNGAGKTTTIKSMLGLIFSSSGNIKLNGMDISKNLKKINKNIGYQPEKVAFYDNLTALQNLHFYAEIKNTPKEDCMKLLEEFKLKDFANKKVKTFSKGMLQKLGLIRAIIGNPTLVILDEPSIGLDPPSILLIRDKLKELNKKGTTIFISSHILSEIQEICNKVAIINKGNLVAQDTISELIKKLNIKPRITIELEKISDKIINAVKKIDGIEKVEVFNNNIIITCDNKLRGKIIQTVGDSGGNIINLYTKETSLEEVFMKYIGAW